MKEHAYRIDFFGDRAGMKTQSGTAVAVIGLPNDVSDAQAFDVFLSGLKMPPTVLVAAVTRFEA